MRHHHDALVREVMAAEDRDSCTDVKMARLSAYVAFWFAGLAGVIERYEQLRGKGAIPAYPEIDRLLTNSFKDTVKQFRNSVAHCSDHDDMRTIELFNHPATIPDQATEIAHAFHNYFELYKQAKG